MGKCLGYILLAGLLSSTCGMAQKFPELQFNHITTSNGLSSNTATCIVEDKQGFIWIGTDNGLNRWDGYRMKQYFHCDDDSLSLISNRILNLYCDRKGNLWIATGGGLSCFLPDKNIFVNYSVDKPAGRRLKKNEAVLTIDGRDSSVWIVNQQNTIFRIGEDGRLQEMAIHTTPFPFENILKEGYDNMMSDSRGNIWGYCANRIYLLDPQTRQPLHTYNFADRLGHASICSMVEDGEGRFWVGTWGEMLWVFDPNRHTLNPVKKIPLTNTLEWRHEDQRWMVASGLYSGVYLIDQKSDAAKKQEYNPADPYSLTGTIFYSLYTDRHQNLWICTDEGVNYVQTGKKNFEIMPVTDPGLPDYDRATTEIPYSYFEDDGETWISKRYKSTFVYDEDFHIKKFYTSLFPLSTTLRRWRLTAYYFFKKGSDLYISTDSGLVVYDRLHSTSRLYWPADKLKEGSFRTIVRLDENRILIRSVTEGLFIFNTSDKTFTRHITSHDSIAGDLPARLNYMLKTSKGNIFLSSDEGHSLIRYDEVKEQFSVVKPLNDSSYHLLSNRVFGMEEDKEGRIWLATGSGIFKYNPETNTIEQHFTNDGRMGSLFRICFDTSGNTWANGNSGIWCYIASKRKWINFNGQDGLPGTDFEGIIARRANGDILAGLRGAVAIFHPEKLNAISGEPPVVITEAGSGDSCHLFPLIKSYPRKLNLPSGQNSFSVDFSVLNYYDASSTRYLYRLEPLMKDFRTNANGHINFDGLLPGHYILHVKGATRTGDAYADEDTIEVDIAPYWYQLWEFRLAVFLLLATLVTILVKRRISYIQNESALRQKVLETEMQALRAQMDPHFIFNSLSSIENFIMQNEKRLASDYLNKFARLIRMILDSSRNELMSVAKDMEALQLYIDLEQISCNNKFTYKAIIDPVLLNEDYAVPPLLIQPYVENAIVHGLMPSRSEDLVLTVAARLDGDSIRYVIQDNGIGREQALLYKARNKPHHKSVGLKITEERINIFNRRSKSNGSVIITDLYDEEKKPRGTRVEITIKAM